MYKVGLRFATWNAKKNTKNIKKIKHEKQQYF